MRMSEKIINVFWLGYYLIHHEQLRTALADSWQAFVSSSSDFAALGASDATEAFSNSWFLAALLHDVAGCVEGTAAVVEKLLDLRKDLGLPKPPCEYRPGWASDLLPHCKDIVAEQPSHFRSEIAPRLADWEKKPKSIDHGFAAGAVLRRTFGLQPGTAALW